MQPKSLETILKEYISDFELEEEPEAGQWLREALQSYALWVVENGKPSAFSSQLFADYESNMRKLIDEV